MYKRLKVIQKFLFEDIWKLRREDISKRQFFLIKYCRIFILAIRRFLGDDCQMKASALTYYTLLSIIPIFALIFGIAKGFGFRETLQRELDARFSEHQEILDWINNFAMSYLDNAKGGAIAGVGLVLLIWSVMKVLGYIERSFNDVWDVQHSRSLVRKFSDYISFMLIATILLIVYSGLAVFISNTINGFSLLKAVGPVIGYIMPAVIVWIVFTLTLMIMPNTKVNVSAAIFGGIISGTLFLVLQFVYIYFQVGVSTYNAIYGSFAAFPLLLAWLQLSWLVVLFGAELSAAFQNVKSFEFESDTKNMSYFYRRLISLMIMKYIVDKFKTGTAPPTMTDMLINLKLPARLTSEILTGLEKSELIMASAVDKSEEKAYLPAFDINQMTVCSVSNKLESYGTSDFLFEENDDFKKLRIILKNFGDMQKKMNENVLLKDL
ncbi:MAG: YihY/virulence factor BrkB family protein [Cytophagaceae bacterium]|jgi:membrane protein|nr:YihY/virulence factor BrkB family protein [Cytophagaceae bacterium]